jgi:hypothetical protein
MPPYGVCQSGPPQTASNAIGLLSVTRRVSNYGGAPLRSCSRAAGGSITDRAHRIHQRGNKAQAEGSHRSLRKPSAPPFGTGGATLSAGQSARGKPLARGCALTLRTMSGATRVIGDLWNPVWSRHRRPVGLSGRVTMVDEIAGLVRKFGSVRERLRRWGRRARRIVPRLLATYGGGLTFRCARRR